MQVQACARVHALSGSARGLIHQDPGSGRPTCGSARQPAVSCACFVLAQLPMHVVPCCMCRRTCTIGDRLPASSRFVGRETFVAYMGRCGVLALAPCCACWCHCLAVPVGCSRVQGQGCPRVSCLTPGVVCPLYSEVRQPMCEWLQAWPAGCACMLRWGLGSSLLAASIFGCVQDWEPLWLELRGAWGLCLWVKEPTAGKGGGVHTVDAMAWGVTLQAERTVR